MSFNRTGRWRRFAAAFAALAVGAATAIAVAPTATAADPESAREVSDGSAHWNFKDSWLKYVTTFAAGTVTPAVGADGRSAYAPASGTYDSSTGDLDVTFSGKTTYASTAHGFDISLANLRVTISGSTGTVRADVGSDDAALLATFDADSASLTFDDGQLIATDLPTVISNDIGTVVSEFGQYAGQAGSLLSFSVTVAPPAPKVWEPKIEVFLNDGSTPLTAGAAVHTGDELTVKGTGFDPAANVGGRGVPIPNTLPQGTYVVLGDFSPNWQPSKGAPSDARKTGAQEWALAESVLDQVPSSFQGSIRKQWAPLSDDGTFETKLTVAPISGGPADGTFGVFTYGAGGVNNAAQELELRLNYPWTPKFQVFQEDGVTPVGNTAVYAGDKLVVKGTGFDPYVNLPEDPTGGVPIPNSLPQGTFAVFGNFSSSKSSTWQPSAGAPGTARQSADSARAWLLAEDTLNDVPTAYQSIIRKRWAKLDPATGSFSTTLTLTPPEELATDGKYGIFTYPGGVGVVTNPSQELSVLLNYQGERPTETTTPSETTTSPTTTTPTAPGQRSTSASVVSATSTGFSVQVTGKGYSAADLPNGVYAALYDDTKGGYLQLNDARGASALAVAVIGGFTEGSWSTTLSGSASALSSTGSYYVVVWPAHTNVSDSNFIANIPVNLSGAAGNTGDGTQGGTSGTATAAVTTVDLAKDRTQTVTASGFTPGETVHGELHSVVVDLGTQVADASGKVTFTFQIPVGFEVGKHAVVLLGAKSGHSVTAPFTVIDSAKAPATTTGSKPASSGSNASTSVTVLGESAQCTEETVPGTAATPRLNWGVKSSFISYINSGVANGTITPAGGAAKAGDSFTWGTGSGSLDASGNGTLTFPGSIHIVAHGGVLDLSISNLKVTAKGKTGTLTATIKSQDMQGNAVPVGSVVLADLSFSSLSATGGKATATLTAAGAAAFAGFYQAGEQLDPITVSFAGGSAATTKTVCRDADGNIVSGGSDASVKSGLASTGVPVGQQLAFALLLLLAGAGAVVLASRRRESRVSRHL